jgi:signal peptidase I
MKIKESLKKFWKFYWKDSSLASYIFFIAFTYLAFTFVLYPGFLFITGLSDVLAIMTPSMEHSGNESAYFYDYYESLNYSAGSFSFNDGLNIGDVIFVKKYANYSVGDVIVFKSPYYENKLVHRIAQLNPLRTKGDNNPESFIFDTVITQVYGKVILKIPFIGLPRYLMYKITGL